VPEGFEGEGMTIYLTQQQGEAYKQGAVSAAIIRKSKKIPQPGTQLNIRAGGWGNSELLGTETCKAVRYVTRLGPAHWSYGVFANHQSLSSLDLSQLASECGMTPSQLDLKWAKQKPEDPMVKVVW
jgi:hypothetical protein